MPLHTLDQRRQHRVRKLMEKGIIRSGPAPTPWQMHQAAWSLFSAITRRDARDMEDRFDTWLSRMPQRGVAQFVLGTYFYDPTGLTRTRKGLIWHILSLNHLLAEGVVFDIEMLASFDHGLEDLMSETKAMISGAHPQAWLARQMVGADDYHPMILEQARRGLKGEFAQGPPLSHVQTTIDLCLSFPATPTDTLAHPEPLLRLAQTPVRLADNIVRALTNAPGYDFMQGVEGFG